MRTDIQSLAALFRAVKPHCETKREVLGASYWALVHSLDAPWQKAAYRRLSRLGPFEAEEMCKRHPGYQNAMGSIAKKVHDARKRIERRLQQDGTLRLHSIASWSRSMLVVGKSGRSWWTNGHVLFDEAMLAPKQLRKLCSLQTESDLTEESLGNVAPSNATTRYEYVGPCPEHEDNACFISECGTRAVSLNPDYSPPRTLWGTDELAPFTLDPTDPTRYVIMPVRTSKGYAKLVQEMVLSHAA